MSSETDVEILQNILYYYRSKCSQLEHDFLVYKLQAEKKISELQQSNQSKDSTN